MRRPSASVRPSTRASHISARTTLRAVLVLLLAIVWFIVPLTVEDATLVNLNYCAVFAIAAIGLVLLSGYGGQSTFAQPTFMLIGAITTVNLGSSGHWPFVPYLAVAVILSGIVGAIVGLIALRLDGPQLAIVTLGVLLIAQYTATRWISVTGGENGKSAADASMSLGFVDMRAIGGYTTAQSQFWFMWLMAAVVALATQRLISHRPGSVLLAVQENPRAAAALGIDVTFEKIKAFVWASAVGGLAGALYAALQQYATPGDFGLIPSVLLLAMVVIGGQKSVWGAVIGALVVWGGKQWVSGVSTDGGLLSSIITVPGGSGGWITPGDLVTLVFGLLMVITILAAPDGLAGLMKRAATRLVSLGYRRMPSSRSPGMHGRRDEVTDELLIADR